MHDKSGVVVAKRDYQQELREMNEALLVSSLLQHELAALALEREARGSHIRLQHA